jgi:hypothetical protein
MVVGFTTSYVIRTYYHWCGEFEFRSWGGIQQYVIKFVSVSKIICFSNDAEDLISRIFFIFPSWIYKLYEWYEM